MNRRVIRNITALIAMLLLMYIGIASAENDDQNSGMCGTNVSWKLENGILTISGNGAMDDFDFALSPWPHSMDEVEKIVVEEGITRIGSYAFYHINTFTAVSMPDSLRVIGDHAFFCGSKLVNLVLPQHLTTIEDHAFSGCTSITTIEIPDTVDFIGNYAFYGCFKLSSIQLPSTMKAYAAESMLSATEIKSITIPEGAVEIGKNCFEGCNYLTTLTLPASVTTIGDYAFAYCSKLADVYYSGTLAQAFSIDIGNVNSNLTCAKWHCTDGEVDGIFLTAGSCGTNAEWTLQNGTLTISGSGAMDDFTAECSPWYPGKERIEEVVIEEGITRIGDYAFNEVGKLKAVTMPDSLREIGILGFRRSGVVNPVLPKHLTKIDHYAFSGCLGITEIKIPDTVTSIGMSAFDSCYNLIGIKLPAKLTEFADKLLNWSIGLKSVVIPEGVTTIGKNCFMQSGLTEITIPATVTTIKDGAFNDCSKLTDVYYSGTLEQSKEIGIGTGNTYLMSAVWHCSSNVWKYNKLILPEDTITIQSEAFAGTAAGIVVIPSGCTTIQSRAFADCADLHELHIPSTVTLIADDIISGSENAVIYGASESAAVSWAAANNIPFVVED